MLAVLLVAVMSLSLTVVPCAHAGTPDLSGLADRAANHLFNEFVKNGAKNGDSYVGSYATWVLTQAGVDVSAWVHDGTSLKDAVIDIVYQDITNPQAAAKVLTQDLLAAQALGRGDLADLLCQVLKKQESGSGFDSSDYAIFSNVPAYELLGRTGCLSEFVYARDYLLSTQNMVYASIPEVVYESVYGSWGSTWGPDFMTTAQAIRTLSYLDPGKNDADIQAAISLGLDWLKKQQKEDGSFVATGWDDPLINTVEAIATLKVLKEDPASLKSSSGKSPVDYLTDNALNTDGSFGANKNAMDAIWALWGYHLLGVGVMPALSITPPSADLNTGDKTQFKAVMFDAYAVDHDVTNDAVWSVADTNVASVAYGLVTGLKAGTTVVSATYGGLTGSAVLTVKSPVPPGGTSTYTVGIAVVGMNGELLYSPGYVTVSASNRWGMTALGALDATGLPYSMSSSWPDFVDSICGQAGSGMAGWCYVVNGNIPSVAAAKYNVRDGDRIIWYYSKNMDQSPPKWEDLVKQAASGTISASTATQQVADILSDLQRGKVVAGQAIAGINEVLGKLKETEVTKELQDRLAEAVKTLSQWVVNLPDKALSVRTDGETASVKVDGDAVKDQVSTIKNAAALAEMLEKFGVAGTASLVTDKIVVELPAELAGKNAFTVDLPADAAQEVAAGNLKLTVKGGAVSLDLPPEALKTVIAAAPSVSRVEVSAEKLDEAKVSVFKEASVIGKKVLNLEINAVTPEGKRASPQAVFTKKITVTFSLDGVDLSRVDKSKLSVYRQKRDGSWEFVGGRLSPDEKSLSFETDHMSLYALLEFKNKFKDIKDHWARDTIELMAMRLIARGIGEDSFAPDQKLTRAQFAALLVRALGLEEQNPQVGTFNDVSPDYWGYKAIEAASRAGLVAGTGAGRFEPERAIKREEMAAILAAILKQNGIDTGLTDAQTGEILKGYADSDQVSEWAKDKLATCISKGIINGRSATTIVPLGNATRAEAVVVLKKLLQLLGRL